MSDSLQPHELQRTRLPCPSQSPGISSDSCPLSRWCHPTISSSATLFSSRLQSFPASGSFPMSQLFISGGQSTGVSASASVLPMNILDWFLLELTGLISVSSKGLSRVFSNTTVKPIIMCKTDSLQEDAAQHGNSAPALWRPRGGMGGGEAGRFRRQGTCVHSGSTHSVVWQKPTYYKATILQLQVDFKKE